MARAGTAHLVLPWYRNACWRRACGGPSARTVAWLAYAVLLLCNLVALAAVLSAPWLRTHGYPRAAWVLYQSLHGVCHQLPARTMTAWGAPLALCSRCAALCVGAAFGLLLVAILRGVSLRLPRRTWLACAACLCGLDVALDWMHVVPNTMLSRSVTGALLGTVAAFYVVPGIVEAALQWAGPRAHVAASIANRSIP